MTDQLLHIVQKERIAPKIAAKIARPFMILKVFVADCYIPFTTMY